MDYLSICRAQLAESEKQIAILQLQCKRLRDAIAILERKAADSTSAADSRAAQPESACS